MQGAQEIIRILNENDHYAYYVGGAVRDYILEIPATDWDIATSANPQEVCEIFSDSKLVGESFPVCLVNGYEVATFRIDHHNGIGDENCITEVCQTIEEDLSRRDFTINAMAMCADGKIIDPFNGFQDIKDRIVRFVGNPYTRIQEDPNRIFRAARMAAKIGGVIEKNSMEAIKNSLHLLDFVAPERIRLEILKAMKIQKTSIFWNELYNSGVLEIIFPDMTTNIFQDGGPYHNESVWEHMMMAGDFISTKCPYVKLAGYLHDVGKANVAHIGPKGYTIFKGHDKSGELITKNFLTRMKFSSKEIKKVSGLVGLHMAAICDGGPKAARKLVKNLNETDNTYQEIFRIRVADNNANLNRDNFTITQIKDLYNRIEESILDVNCALKITDLYVNGKDVMDVLSVTPGPVIGEVLQKLFEKVEENPSLNNREVLLEMIQQLSI